VKAGSTSIPILTDVGACGKAIANNVKSQDPDKTSYIQTVHDKTGTITPSTYDEQVTRNSAISNHNTGVMHDSASADHCKSKHYTARAVKHTATSSGALHKVDKDVLTISNEKSSTGISESSPTRQSVQKLSAAEKSEATSDWQVVVRLHNTPKDMDKEAVTKYLADISAYKLSEAIVRITPIDSDTGTIVVSVKCPTEELQMQFLDAVKQSYHSACAKCKTSAGDRVDNNNGRGTKPTIKLRITMTRNGLKQEDIDKAVVVAFIK